MLGPATMQTVSHSLCRNAIGPESPSSRIVRVAHCRDRNILASYYSLDRDIRMIILQLYGTLALGARCIRPHWRRCLTSTEKEPAKPSIELRRFTAMVSTPSHNTEVLLLAEAYSLAAAARCRVKRHLCVQCAVGLVHASASQGELMNVVRRYDWS